MSQINVTDLTFAHEGSYDNVFENVSFQIDTDWKLGFVGRNGRGKTTFLKLLLGELEHSGNITASVNFEYFPYELTNKSALTIDALKSIVPDAMDWEISREISLLDVDEDVLGRPFSTLSNGEQTKTLLAVLFLKGNSFLLIDEPTNHLDVAARQVVGRYLKRKSGFILVSHDRALLDGCVDHILSINKANIEIQRGNFYSWQENKRLQDGFELAENEKLQRDISRLSSAAKHTASWSNMVENSKYGGTSSGLKVDRGYVGHKSAKMMQRSKNIQTRQQNAIEEKGKLLRNIETSESLFISPLEFHVQVLLEVENLSITYGDKIVCADVNFTVKRGQRLALSGKNGCGKSSIFKLICGQDIPHRGTVRLGSGLQISYVSQDTSELCGSLRDYAESCGIDESTFKTLLRKLDFSRVQFEKDISEFSGGQKKKVLLARSLCQQAHLYIWDEPLNFIDVLSRIQIEELLLEYQPTLLLVEHDQDFCKNVVTETILL